MMALADTKEGPIRAIRDPETNWSSLNPYVSVWVEISL